LGAKVEQAEDPVIVWDPIKAKVADYQGTRLKRIIMVMACHGRMGQIAR